MGRPLVDVSSCVVATHSPDGKLRLPVAGQGQLHPEAEFCLRDWRAHDFSAKTREDPRKTEALIRAVKSGQIEAIDALVAAGAWVRHCDANGGTPLHFAAYHGQLDAARALLRHRADPDDRDDHEFRATPLHAAARHGHVPLVDLLLKAGADRDAKDFKGHTPSEVAHVCGHRRVAKLLDDAFVHERFDGARLSANASASIDARSSNVDAESQAKQMRLGFFNEFAYHNDALLAAAGLQSVDGSRLLVIAMESLTTVVMDAVDLAAPFAFGAWSVEGTQILREELLRFASVVAERARNYTCVLLVGPVGQSPWPDAQTMKLKAFLDEEPQSTPLRALRLTLRGTLPKAKLHVYNSTRDQATGRFLFPQPRWSG